FVVAETFHRRADSLLSGIELIADLVPVTFPRRLDDAETVRAHRPGKTEGLGKGEDTAADLLNLIGIFRLHRDKTLTDEAAEGECEDGPVAALFSFRRQFDTAVPVRFIEFIEHRKDLGRNRNDHLINEFTGEIGQVNA